MLSLSNILLVIVIFISLLFIKYIPVKRHKREIESDSTLPSCKDCKRQITNFCKKDPNCQGKNCEIDELCSDKISYSCDTKDFQCNPHTCRDFYELQKDKKWGCYGMF